MNASNNEVYLLVGPRGSGKSTYTKQFDGLNDTFVISRDEILIRLFGSTHLDSYSGGHQHGDEVMNRLLRRKLSTQNGVKIILDTWNGSNDERRRILEKLREYGATKVTAIFFSTRVEFVDAWFWRKPGIVKFSERKTNKEGICYMDYAPKRDYELFHLYAAGIEHIGFDAIVYVDPSQGLLLSS